MFGGHSCVHTSTLEGQFNEHGYCSMGPSSFRCPEVVARMNSGQDEQASFGKLRFDVNYFGHGAVSILILANQGSSVWYVFWADIPVKRGPRKFRVHYSLAL